MPATRTDALKYLSVISALVLLPALAPAQSTMPAPRFAPASPAVTPPATAPAPAPIPAPAPTIAPSTEVPSATQPFVGTVTSDKVYVRSGPGSIYYELGHLGKGDTVQVVSSRQGWYQILPPNGAFCLIGKDFVETDSSGKSGTVKADYVNLRAGTAMSAPEGAPKDSSVLCVVRKGTKLTILGSTDKYYQVAPTDRAYVWISSQFIKTAAGAEYKIPDLKLTAGAASPFKDTVSSVPTTLAPAPVEVTPAPTPAPTLAETQPSSLAETRPAPVPTPTPAFTADAYTRFDDLNKRYQSELLKPVGHRDGLDALIKDYQDLLADKKPMPPSVKQGSEARLADLQKLAAIQRLQKENTTSTESLVEQRKALQEQYASAEKALEAYENTGPYLAQGTLQTSAVVEGKYALVNPATGRTVAYVDPKSAIDIGSLLGKYIGVRGTTHKAQDADIDVIQVKNATLLAPPTTEPAKQNP